MSYRPITDVWILARPKVKYYGAYPNGFLERANILLGVSPVDSVLHVCGGHAKAYPNRKAIGVGCSTLDLDPDTKPDYLRDAREILPLTPGQHRWDAILCDPPYTDADAAKYQPGAACLPTANQLLRHAVDAVKLHGRIGVLHYILPQPPKTAKFVACVGVIVGFNNRMRVFSVFERTA